MFSRRFLGLASEAVPFSKSFILDIILIFELFNDLYDCKRYCYNKEIGISVLSVPLSIYEIVFLVRSSRLSKMTSRKLTGFFDAKEHGLREDFRLTKFSLLKG